MERPAQKVKKTGKKGLQSGRPGGIIIKHDCDRYALKREVAAFSPVISVEYVRF
jgi:hypothetical protein